MRKALLAMLLTICMITSGANATAAIAPISKNSRNVSVIAKNSFVRKIKLNVTSVVIKNKYNAPNTYQFKATTVPASALVADPSLTWTSSREHVATVSQDGLVSAVGEGATLITVSANDQGGIVKATALVKVAAVRAKGIRLDTTLLYMDHTSGDKTAKIGYTVSPANATFQIPVWTSSDPDIASVDSSTGLITAKSAGSAKITASVDGGRVSASCEVKVRNVGSMKKITIGAVGDLVLGGSVKLKGDKRFDNILTNNGTQDPDYSYTFKNVKPVLDSFDLTIGNLEVALTDWKYALNPSSSFNFKGKPAYAKILKQGGIDIVSVENNHAYDFGGYGINHTQDALRNNDVKCASRKYDATETVNGVTVTVVSMLSQSVRTAASIKGRVRRAKATSDVVILYLHSCEVAMYDHKIASSQITMAKAAINSGADVVFLMHPAVLSGIGVYKGKYIYFDLGTFVGSGVKTCVNNMLVEQPLYIGTDQNGTFVECGVPTIYPGNSSGLFASDSNNCQPVLYNSLGTQEGREKSDDVVAMIDKYSKALTWKYGSSGVEIAKYNVG